MARYEGETIEARQIGVLVAKDGAVTAPAAVRLTHGSVALMLPEDIAADSFEIDPALMVRGVALPDGGRVHGRAVYLYCHSPVVIEASSFGIAHGVKRRPAAAAA